MRICDLTTLYLDGGQGGVNTYLEEKARFFTGRTGYEHLIVVPGQRDERRTLHGSTLHTIKSPPLPSNPQHRVLARLGEVRRILLEEQPDVVEVDCAYLLGKVAHETLGERARVVGFYHVHLPTFIARPSASRFSATLAGAAEHYAWRYVDYCHRFCDRLIVSSSDMRARLLARGYTRLEQVPLGVNTDLFRPRPELRASGGPVTFLYVGRLSMEKDVHVLLEAFHLLSRRGDYRLRIVGDGPMRAKLERQARSEPRIRFQGAVEYGEGLARIYAEADVLTVPSPNDTFNLTVLEGLASGLPVVAMERGGPVDMVRAEVGALARPGDAGDLAAKMELTATRPPSPAACRDYAMSHYSWERTFTRLLEVYQDTRPRSLQGAASVSA